MPQYWLQLSITESFSLSIKLHYDNLRALLNDEEPFPSYTTVRSYFRAKALRKMSRRSHRVAVTKQFASRENQKLRSRARERLLAS
jgi:hypothetical protein